jgi:hypothetical protein
VQGAAEQRVRRLPAEVVLGTRQVGREQVRLRLWVGGLGAGGWGAR